MPQTYYIVADGNAYAIDENGYMFGAPVFKDNSVDWEHSYEFDPCDEDVDYVAHMCKMLQDIQAMSEERKYGEVFIR
jgi:hypothetical protein|tara:strand:- start:343 stop:573 length:231 start_codon:yes stop_codon:yes gene_type:complete